MPTIRIRGRTYIVDARLQQLRNTRNLADFMSFTEFEQATMVAALNAKAMGDKATQALVLSTAIAFSRALGRDVKPTTLAELAALRKLLPPRPKRVDVALRRIKPSRARGPAR